MAQSLTADDVLHSAIVGVWVDLDAAGVELRLSADGGLLVGPPGRVTPEQVAVVRTHKAALRLLVSLYDRGVAERRAAFEAEYARASAPGVPLLLWRAGVPYVSGTC